MKTLTKHTIGLTSKWTTSLETWTKRVALILAILALLAIEVGILLHVD
jgi:hypothetical protein